MAKRTEKIRHYEKRFGTVAVEKGYITVEELIEALSIQVKEESEKGSHRLIGGILFDQDILTGKQVQEVVDVVLRSKRT